MSNNNPFGSGDPFGDMFGDILGGKSGSAKDGSISDSKKIDLQHEMLVKLAARVVALENKLATKSETISKLNTNNTKTIAQVKKLTARVKVLEEAAEEPASTDLNAEGLYPGESSKVED